MIFKPHEVLDILAPHLPHNPVIIEAGSFNGSDTLRLATQWPHSMIHACEPVPELFWSLQARTKDLPNVRCYQQALSSHEGYAKLYLSVKPEKNNKITQASSLLAPKERLKDSSIAFPMTISVPITTLDAWAAQHKITHIDLLWLDVQGHELAVLHAAPIMLKNLRALYVEVATIERYAGQPLYHEIRTWLESKGFTFMGVDFDQATRSFGNALFINNHVQSR